VAQVRGVAQDPQNPNFRKVGRNIPKGRQRSHHDEARRHHAVLLAAFTPASVTLEVPAA
jgi:hypothetical protein